MATWGFKDIIRHGTMAVKALCHWMAKDVGLVLLWSALYCCLIGFSVYSIETLETTTRGQTVVDIPDPPTNLRVVPAEKIKREVNN